MWVDARSGRWRLTGLVLCLCLWSLSMTLTRAGEPDGAPNQAFLEYLGRFGSADGHWVDPMIVATPAEVGKRPTDTSSGERKAVPVEHRGNLKGGELKDERHAVDD